jgi:hypothetical protein
MKGCIKRVFSNTIKKVMISLKKLKTQWYLIKQISKLFF